MCRVNCVYKRKRQRARGSPREEKSTKVMSVCMHVQEKKLLFPGCLVSFNVQNVYMNDAKEKFADKALI